ncbi:MAG: hypothetical protein R2710_01850 [Acidimicrobiales bacterium]
MRIDSCSSSDSDLRPPSGSATTFGRLGNNRVFADFVRGKSPDDLALFGVPRPGHSYWTEATVDAMGHKYPGLDMAPWSDALPA